MENWPVWKYHPVQRDFWECQSRFICVTAGRKSGKTEESMRKLVLHLPAKKAWGDPRYFYAAPTYKQARSIAWEPFLRLIPDRWVDSINETRLEIKTVFGSQLNLFGLDSSHRLEGPGYDGGILDECSDIRPKTFELTFLPAMAHRRGWCIFTGIPKRFGIGGAEYKERFYRYLNSNSPDEAAFTWTSESIVPDEEIRIAKETLDAKDYAEQYLASWETVQGGIFHAFDQNRNVDPDIEISDQLPIIVGADFNVNPMCWILCQYWPDGVLRVFDELFIRNTNTMASLDHLATKLGERAEKQKVIFIGDASGAARKTASNASDWLIIANDQRLNAMTIYPKGNPAVQDRFANTNFALVSSAGTPRLKIHPRCRNLIRDLEQRSYKDGTRIPNDSGDIGHMTDALGYVTWHVVPMQLNQKTADMTLQSFHYLQQAN